MNRKKIVSAITVAVFLAVVAIIPFHQEKVRKENADKECCVDITTLDETAAEYPVVLPYEIDVIKESIPNKISVSTAPMGISLKDSAQDEVVTTEEIEEFAEKKFVPYEMFTNSCVNLRKEPSTESQSLDVLMPNVEVEVIGESDEWSNVRIDYSVRGYIKSELLSEEVTPIEELNRWGISLTKDEIDLLACIVYLESGIDSMAGKEAVVESIFNRMAFSENYEGTLYEVLSRERQYETWPKRWKANPSQDEYEAIYNVLYGRTYWLNPDYVYFSLKKINGHDFMKVGNYHWFSRE